MERKDSMDALGAGAMVVFATVLAVNQVVIKLTNDGLSPVFSAGLRSAIALAVLLIWVKVRGKRISFLPGVFIPALAMGLVFSAQFVFLFIALDLTTVSRASVLFYSMPVWLAGVAHFVLPGETLTRLRLIGLAVAMAGVIWALVDPHTRSQGSLTGDLAAIGAALGWAGIALLVRLTSVSKLNPESQLFWQLSVSAVVLTACAPLFGDPIREFTFGTLAGLGYQSLFVASFGFLFWLSWMRIYPASDIASFSFLSPVLSVMMGWLILGEDLGPNIIGALVLVAIGITLINWRQRSKQRTA